MASYSFIDLVPAIAEREHGEGWAHIFGAPLRDSAGVVTITHVLLTIVLVLVIMVMALIARKKYATKESALIPDGKFNITNFFEAVFEYILGMMTDIMGEKYAKRFFPLIASLALFIFLGNIMGLVPGLGSPTTSINTGFACGLVVFLVYNVSGFKENGWGYLQHFFGPVAFIAPFFFLIELIGHALRPVTLSVRLGAVMSGDHMVLEIFGGIGANIFGGVPLLLPIPFLFLGLLVSTVQALVFALLSSIYIGLAVHHDDDH